MPEILNDIIGGTSDNTNAVEEKSTANPEYTKLLNQYKGSSTPKINRSNFKPHAEKQDFLTYFPSEQNNIQKGSYSGAMIGSNPIYAPSQLMPYGLIDARQKALADAADQKAAENDAFAQRILKAPTTKRKAVQQTMQNDFYKGINDYKANFIKDNPRLNENSVYKALGNDPGFNKYLTDQQTRFQMEDEGVNAIAHNQTESEKEGKFMFGQQKQDNADFMSGKIDNMMSSTDPKDRQEAQDAHERIMSQRIMNHPQKVLTDFKAHTEPDDIESLQGISDKGAYDLITTGSTKGIKNPEAALRVTNGLRDLYKQEYAGQERATGMTEDQFVAQGLSQFGTTKKVTVQTASTKDDGTSFHMDENSLSKSPTSVSSETGVADANGKVPTGSFTMLSSSDIPSKNQQPFQMTISSDMKNVEGKAVGKGVAGNRNVRIAKVGNAITVMKEGSADNGKSIDEKDIEKFKTAGFKIKVAPTGIATVMGHDDDGKVNPLKDETISVDLNSIKNNVMKINADGTYKSGVNIPLLEKNAKAAEEHYNTPSSAEKKYILNGVAYKASALTKAGHDITKLQEYKP